MAAQSVTDYGTCAAPSFALLHTSIHPTAAPPMLAGHVPRWQTEPLAPGGRCDAGGAGGANVQHIGRTGRAGRAGHALFCEMNTSRQLRAMNTTRSPGKRGSM